MIAVDTNVLVYAHRRSFPRHKCALRWIEHLAGGSRPWALPVFCLGEFLRVVTHARVLDPPSSLDQALGAIEGLLQSPSLRVISPGPRYPGLLAAAARDGDARGNLAYDAQLVALCMEQGVATLLTEDRDLRRFQGPRVITLDEEPA